MESDDGFWICPNRDLRIPLPDGPVLRTHARCACPGVVCRESLVSAVAHDWGMGCRSPGGSIGHRKAVGTFARCACILRRSHRCRLGCGVSGLTGRRVPALGVAAARRRIQDGVTETSSRQVGRGDRPNGGRKCHSHRLRASACGDMAVDAGTRASSQVVDWMVGRLCGPGLLLVDRRDSPSGKIRIQLPSVYRDAHCDHIYGFCLRRASWHIVLAELRRQSADHSYLGDGPS